jgi:hypothetical protein
MKAAAENAKEQGCSMQMALKELSYLCFFYEPDSSCNNKKEAGV